MPLHYRKCTLSDLDELVAIARKTFVDAFEKHNDPQDFKAYVAMAFEPQHMAKQLKNLDSSFYFVFKDAVLVGYFKLNENEAQTDLQDCQTIELERIYVLQEFQGNQIGRKMLQKALKLASEKEKNFIWLGVWENNTDAIRFYEIFGFSKFDTHPYYIGKDKQTDWLMRFDMSTFPMP